MTEEGYEIVKSPLPCVLTVVKEINEPRLPSLKGKMKAKKIEIPFWKALDLDMIEERLGLNGSPTFVNKIFTPPPRAQGEIMEASDESIKKLTKILKDCLN